MLHIFDNHMQNRKYRKYIYMLPRKDAVILPFLKKKIEQSKAALDAKLIYKTNTFISEFFVF
jgi:hypothetical protein